MHIYHVASGTPVTAILRQARTPKGSEVCTVIKHVTKRLRRHWPKTRLVWRGDSHYGRVEAMDWAEDSRGARCGLHFWPRRQCRTRRPGGGDRGQSALLSCDEQQAEAAHLCELPVPGRQLEAAAQSRGAARVLAAAGRRVDRLRQEVDIRYVVTSLKGSVRHLYENVYCQRGQMENLIKLHKAQLASDRMSCHSATANQVRLVLHTAAFWLMHGVRAAIPREQSARWLRVRDDPERLLKIGARVIEHLARIRVQLPTSGPKGALFRTVALASCRPAHRPRGRVPHRAADMADQPRTRRTASVLTPIPPDGPVSTRQRGLALRLQLGLD